MNKREMAPSFKKDEQKRNETILRRVQKALKLAHDAGSTQEEAQNALLAAQRLAIAHGISVQDAGKLPPADSQRVVHVTVKAEGLECWWRDRLTSLVTNNFRWDRILQGEAVLPIPPCRVQGRVAIAAKNRQKFRNEYILGPAEGKSKAKRPSTGRAFLIGSKQGGVS